LAHASARGDARPPKSFPRRARTRALPFILVTIFLITSVGWAQPPALPQGLESGTPPASAAPSLPAGLEGSTPPETKAESTAPPLPAGLEESAKSAPETSAPEKNGLPFPLHGFWDTRAGLRTGEDPAQSKTLTLGETRLQLTTDHAWKRVGFDVTADTLLDAVEEEPDFDLRQLRLTWTPLDNVDIRIGRQVLTWGTGDMLFINDLFPKDWNSFFIGRDTEYLKAPSDALRAGWFNDWMNVEVVYTPKFDPDRYITGERISYYSALHGRTVGKANALRTDEPDRWFSDDEWALRLSRNIGSAQLAFYGYSGFWKSPGGMSLLPPTGIFPGLRVYGASLRGTVAKGVGNIEVGYYDSFEDRAGSDVFINNSEFRVLIGYERELAKEFTGAVQYYVEHMMDHGAYRRSLWFFMPERDANRHVVTLRLTKLLMNQNLMLSLFTYYSPSDQDAYLRPSLSYKVNDHWAVDFGGNVFLGTQPTTFFGQFQDNTNVYAGLRYAF
jgi:hypothetical protein